MGLWSGLLGLGLSVLIRVVGWYNNIGLYNVIISGHGIVMIFLFLMPTLIGGMGNFLCPLLINAEEVAFPRTNALAFWLVVVSLFSVFLAYWYGAGAGWTIYPPLSNSRYQSSSGIDLAIFALHISGISSLLGAINFLCTICLMKRVRWDGLDLFV